MKSLLLLAAGLLAGVAITIFLWPVAPMPPSPAPSGPAPSAGAVTEASPSTSTAEPAPVAVAPSSPAPSAAPGSALPVPTSPRTVAAPAAPTPLSPPTASRFTSGSDARTPLTRAREAIQRRTAAATQSTAGPATTLRVAIAPTASSSGPIVDLRIPAGSKLPLALTDNGQGLTGPQLSAVDASAAEFVEQLQSTARTAPAGQPVSPQTLRTARQLSDEHYRTIFGYQAADQAAVRNASPQTQPAPAAPAPAP